MITVRCEQCAKTGAQRRRAKTCSGLCRQHRRRGHPPVVPPLTLWERFKNTFEEAKVLAATTEDPVVSAFILVLDDDGEALRM